MYSVNSKNNRVTVQCNILKKGRIKFLEAVYDTGARYTCFHASFIDSSLKEEEFKDEECKALSGFVGSQASIFYKFEVDRFAFGNIDLSSQFVWITFDPDVTSNVVGLDIIRRLTRLSIGETDEIRFFESIGELKRFVENI